MRKWILTALVLVGVFLAIAPTIAQAQVKSQRVQVQATDSESIKQKVAERQAEIRARVAAAMADTDMPVVARKPIPTSKPTVAAVVAAPPAAPSVPGPCLECSYKDRLIAAWPGNDSWAVSTTSCESGINPFARNPSGKYKGMWQMDQDFWIGYGGREFGPDPITRLASEGRDQRGLVEEQTLVAWRGYQARGAQPWSCG